jgi:hypothetical protein
MYKAVLSESQTAILKRFDEVGGCVNYVVFDCDSSAEDITLPETHRYATIAALETIGQRWAEHAVKASKEQNVPIEKIFVLKIDFERAKAIQGKKITYQDFFGPKYDFQQKQFFDRDAWMGTDCVGYAHAFSDPPYTLHDDAQMKRISMQEATELFHRINQEVLGGITPQSIIYEWPVDWSNFFDAGKEWWGSFLWTFANPGTHRIVVLAASTTD